jgi:hypothetical protein
MGAKGSVRGGAFTQDPSDEKYKVLYQVMALPAAIKRLHRVLFIILLIRNANQRHEPKNAKQSGLAFQH